MVMNREALQNILKDHYLDFLPVDLDFNINDFKFLKTTSDPLKSDILYVCENSKLPNSALIDQTVNILSVDDIPLPDEYKGNPRINLILLDKTVDVYAVFNDIKDVFMKDYFRTQNSLKLLEALAQESGLEKIIEIGYEMLGNPFTITDMSNKRIAVTNHAELNDDPVWNEIVEYGYTSFTSWSFYLTNSLVEMIDKNESPFFWTDTYSKYPRIMGSIKMGSKHIATIGVCAHEKPFRDSDLELASLLCKAVSIELQKNEFVHYSQGLIHENFIEDLLERKVTGEKVISERAKTLHLKFMKNLFVMVIDMGTFGNEKTTLTYMRNELEKMISNGKAVVHAKNIVIIMSCDNEKLFMKTDVENIKQFLKTNNMYAGISRSFNSLVKVPDHYLQSVEALKLGLHINKEAILFEYEDYAIYHLTDICSSHGNLKENCHPSLLKLIEYDKQNNTNYTHSLYTYIISSKNLTDSANTLNIHRNTMSYRIEKIEGIMNVNLNDSNILLNLHLSFKILEFLKSALP